MGQQVGKCFHDHSLSKKRDAIDLANPYVCVSQHQSQLETQYSVVPTSSNTPVGERLMRLSKNATWNGQPERSISFAVLDFYRSVEGHSDNLSHISVGGATHQLTSEVTQLLNSSRGRYSQGIFSLPIFLHTGLARVDVIIGSIAPPLVANQEPKDGHAFYIADVYMVNIARLTMTEIHFLCGLALSGCESRTSKTLIPEVLTIMASLLRLSPQEHSYALLITANLVKMRKLLHAALTQRSAHHHR